MSGREIGGTSSALPEPLPHRWGGEGQEEKGPCVPSCPWAVSVRVGRDGDEEEEGAGCSLPVWEQRLHLEAMSAGLPQRPHGGDDAVAPLAAEGEGAVAVLLQQPENGAVAQGGGRDEVNHVPAGSDAQGKGQHLVPQRGGPGRAAERGAGTHAQPAGEMGNAGSVVRVRQWTGHSGSG